jgi:hypothetical protein
MPKPVAMSAAQAEYNQACIATMGLLQISMAMNNFKLMEEDHMQTKSEVHFMTQSTLNTS